MDIAWQAARRHAESFTLRFAGFFRRLTPFGNGLVPRARKNNSLRAPRTEEALRKVKYVKMKIIYLAAKILDDHQSSLLFVALLVYRWMDWRVAKAGKVCFGSSRA